MVPREAHRVKKLTKGPNWIPLFRILRFFPSCHGMFCVQRVHQYARVFRSKKYNLPFFLCRFRISVLFRRVPFAITYKCYTIWSVRRFVLDVMRRVFRATSFYRRWCPAIAPACNIKALPGAEHCPGQRKPGVGWTKKAFYSTTEADPLSTPSIHLRKNVKKEGQYIKAPPTAC